MLPYAFWVVICSWLVFTGWVLSLIGELNAVGYGTACVLLIVFCSRWVPRYIGAPFKRSLIISRLYRRYCRPLPLVYLIYLLTALIGGALYAPTNYDGLCYLSLIHI